MASITGTADPETLDGTEDADTIKGLGGDDTLNGLGGNDSLDGGAGVDSMDGGTGDDVFYVDNAGDLVFEAPFEGNDTVITKVSFTLGAGQEVETLRTPGSATTSTINLTGNELANILLGNAGTNTLKGGAGADYLRGYAGNDTYWVDNAGDQVIEASGGGSDTVITNVSYVLGAGQEIEVLRTFGSATTEAINLTGNAFANTLVGNAAANVLDGRAGADILRGYGGNDTYYVDNAGDAIFEASGEGDDTVIARTSYTLAGGVSVERLRTSGSSTTAAINLTGNELVQMLAGNAAANVLDGGGGADILVGYAGNDTYRVDNANDVVVEADGEGTDTVITTVSFSLLSWVEILKTYDPASTEAINLTGNVLDNRLEGNAGANVLDGRSGNDTLWGYAGDDIYYADNGDTVHETAGQGVDTIITQTSFTLSSGLSVEVLKVAAGVGGNYGLQLNGNELANTIEGTPGEDTISGAAGADIMRGLSQNDTYYVDNAGDVVEEVIDGGGLVDTVVALVSYTLGAGQEVEVLRTLASSTTAVIDLAGNELANTVAGNAAANVLDGGAGNDILWGYAGNDTFAFTTVLGAANVDTIFDFNAADDTINIDNAVFASLSPGALPAGAFNTGAAATEADDRIIYNSATGQLMFDVDGLGGAAAVQFATLSGAPVIAANDFLVI